MYYRDSKLIFHISPWQLEWMFTHSSLTLSQFWFAKAINKSYFFHLQGLLISAKLVCFRNIIHSVAFFHSESLIWKLTASAKRAFVSHIVILIRMCKMFLIQNVFTSKQFFNVQNGLLPEIIHHCYNCSNQFIISAFGLFYIYKVKIVVLNLEQSLLNMNNQIWLDMRVPVNFLWYGFLLRFLGFGSISLIKIVVSETM